MKKSEVDQVVDELPLEGLILQCKIDKYKLAYSAIRLAKEIKQKESLPDLVQTLIPRALKDILTGKITIKEIEKLPILARVSAPAPAMPVQPTITLNVAPEDKEEEKLTLKKQDKEEEEPEAE